MADTLEKLEAVAEDDLLRQLHAIAITVDIDEYGLPLNVVGAPATDAMLKMRAAVASFADRIRADQREKDAAMVPTSWLDSLLTGPEAVVGKPPFGCPDIERLLSAIASAIRSTAADAPNKERTAG